MQARFRLTVPIIALIAASAISTLVPLPPVPAAETSAAGSFPSPTVPILSAGALGTTYLRADGSLWTFGTTGTVARSQPTRLRDGIVDVATGSEHVIALRADGVAIGWGRNLWGQLGTEADLADIVSEGAAVPVLDDVVAVAAGGTSSYLVRSDGSLWAIGSNNRGQLGVADDAGANVAHPEPVHVMDHVLSVHAGGIHVLVIDDQHRLWSFGANDNGQLGRPGGAFDATPRLVASGVRTASAGGHHSLVVARDGSVSAVGYHFTGAGLATSRAFGAPFVDLPVAGAAAVASDDFDAAVLLADGTLYRADASAPSPVLSITMHDVSAVSTNGGATVAARIDGSLWTYGTDTTPALLLGRPVPLYSSTSAQVDAGLVRSGLQGLVPARLLDTRAGGTTIDGVGLGGGPVAGGTSVPIQVAGRAGVPWQGAVAVVLNVAVTESAGPGFVTVSPCDEPRPTAANLNHTTGQTTSNSVVAKLDLDGRVCVYTMAASHLVVDVQAWFGIGTYLPITPRRLLETRGGLATYDGQFNAIGSRAAGQTTPLDVRYRAVILEPSAMLLNVAAVSAGEPGFVTAWGCAGERPNAAGLTYAAGQTVPNLVVAATDASARTCLFTYGRTDLVVDAAGGFPRAGSGFHAMTPARLADTRPGYPTIDGRFSGGGPNGGGATLQLEVVGRAGIPSAAGSVILGISAVGARDDGFVTVYPCGSTMPTAANLNVDRGATASNTTFARVGADGRVCIYTYATTDLVVDVDGWFPG